MKKIIVLVCLVFGVIVSNAQCVSTLAGSGVAGFTNGTGTSAQFSYPKGIAIDASGNVYVADTFNKTIRKITLAGAVTTFAGSGTQGYADGIGTAAKFYSPSGVAVDGSGNVYVADTNNHRIRKITTSGVVTTLAGSGTAGYADGTGTSAQFFQPLGVAVDGSGNVYVADYGNHRIRKITSSGVVNTLAGSGVAGYADGTGTVAQFNWPSGVEVDGSGNVYVADYTNHRIRKITPSGVVSTLAGSGTAGFADGIGIAAKFYWPSDVAVDGSGNVYVADSGNHRIRKITPAGVVTSLAGSGIAGYLDGTGTSVQFYQPIGVAVDGSGNVYVADYINHRIRKIIPLSVSLNYSSLTFCVTQLTAQSTTLTGDGAYIGGIYSSSAGLSINNVTGTITPSTSTPGTYTITYTTPSSGSCQISTTTQVTILPLPTATISYSGTPFCKSLVSAQSVTLTGTGTYTGGTYSSTTGLTINASTGAINPSTSTPGTYTVAYATSTSSGCVSISTTTQVTIIAPNANAPTASITYNNNGNQYTCIGWCSSGTANVVLTGTGSYLGGVFSVEPSGLGINSSTGQIFPSSQSGTYTIYYNLPSNLGCLSSTVSTIVNYDANFIPPVQFHYSNNTFCNNLSTPQDPIADFGQTFQNGFFTSNSSGLNINFITGVITPSSSIPGSYFVYFNPIQMGCCPPQSTGTYITITAIPSVNISYPSSPYYNLNSTPQPVSISGNGAYTTGTYSSTVGLSINPSTGAITPSSSTPGTYTVTYTIPADQCWPAVIATAQVVISAQPNIGNLSISSSTTTVGLFDTITVDVQLTNATNLYSLYMKLKGNAAVSQYLDYSGHTAGTLLGTNVISTPPTITNGVPDFGMTKVGAVPGYSGSGLFYSFRFVPKNNVVIPAGTTFCFYLDNVSSYNSSGIPCNLTNQGQYCYTFTNQVAVWPGDLNKSNTVTTADLLPIGYFYNSTGAARPNATIQWTAQPATLWGYNRTSTNSDAYKVFADSNGDGVINNADQAAIGFNMNQVHNRMVWQAPDHFSAQAQQTLAVGSLTVIPNSTIINGAALPQTVTFTVSVNNTGGLNALYGMSVNLGFDNTVFDLSTATVDYTGSIFGNAGSDCLALNYNSDNTVSVGLTRFGNAPINGQGLLFKVTIQTKTTLPNLTQTPVTAYVDAANNQAGDTLVIQDAAATNFTIINNLGLDTIKQDEFVLYPNPASDVVYLQMGANTQLAGMKVKVVNLLGQVIEEQPIQNTTTELTTKNWGAAGVYFVQIINQNNTTSITKKVIVKRK